MTTEYIKDTSTKQYRPYKVVTIEKFDAHIMKFEPAGSRNHDYDSEAEALNAAHENMNGAYYNEDIVVLPVFKITGTTRNKE